MMLHKKEQFWVLLKTERQWVLNGQEVMLLQVWRKTGERKFDKLVDFPPSWSECIIFLWD